MASPPSHWALKARYVFPVACPPIAAGTLCVSGSMIAAADSPATDLPVLDLGNVALVPGFVNAHAHLEFSDLAAPLGVPGSSLPDWIRAVVSHRRSAAADDAPIVQGLRESLASGTTALGEIATRDWRQASEMSDLPITTLVFHESIAPTRDRVEPARVAAERFLSATVAGDHLHPGLSPHAPYTVHPRLLAALVGLCRRYDVPLAMHLAESRAELELLAHGAGPFRELLRDLNAWDPSADARLPSILDYLEKLAEAPRALVVHGNYLDAAETEFLAAHAGKMTVVYCPRTHSFFGHEPYPLAARLSAGVSLALGTDSRASNPNLSLFEEMQFVARHHPQVNKAKVLELGTLDGARALGLADRMGSLVPGKQANFAVIGLGDGDADDPHELLFAPSARVVQTWIGGQITHASS
jgi:cytosine/adenosine deaminase-related metal-dependent hydrolase